MTSSTDVLDGRQLPGGIPPEEIRAALTLLVEIFGARWLESDSPSAVQSLWNRRDMTSTWELFWLGASLERMKKAKAWLTNQVNVVKTGQRNERIGAAFEILAAALFASSRHEILPARRNQPGFDASLQFEDGNVAAISLKNFGRTSYQKQFDHHAERTCRQVEAAISQGVRQWTGVAAFSEAYPANADWSELQAHITRRLPSCQVGQSEALGTWSILYTGPPRTANLHSARQSFSLQIVARQYANESRNIESSLENAFAGFDKHMPSSVAGTSNVMLVRVGQSFSVPDLLEWSKAHLSRVGTKLDEIFLYQPAVAQSLADGSISLTHHVSELVVGPNRHPAVNVSFPVGTISSKPTRQIFIAGHKDVALQNYHLFQRGEVFHSGSLELDKKVELPFDFGPGIIAHSVLRLMDSSEEGVFSPLHPLNWDLSLLND